MPISITQNWGIRKKLKIFLEIIFFLIYYFIFQLIGAHSVPEWKTPHIYNIIILCLISYYTLHYIVAELLSCSGQHFCLPNCFLLRLECKTLGRWIYELILSIFIVELKVSSVGKIVEIRQKDIDGQKEIYRWTDIFYW